MSNVLGRWLCFAMLALGQPQGERDWAEIMGRFRSGVAGSHEELVAAGKDAIPHVVKVMRDPNAGTARFRAANVLGGIAHPDCFDPLMAALEDPWFNVRRCAAMALTRLKDERARGALEKLAKEDPFEWRDPKTGEVRYLVREDARRALAELDRRLAGPEPVTFLRDAAKMPPWSPPAGEPVPWPFPGSFEAQKLYNNYQQPTGIYVHAGLDLLQPVGTPVRAVQAGTVRCISTNYPDWNTHHFFVIESVAGSGEGWCYTHVDPSTYTFEVGSEVEAGEVLGKLVDFSVGANDGVDHLHLNYVRFVEKPDGKVETESLYDPLVRFAWKDTRKPTVHPPQVVRPGTVRPWPAGEPVSGEVDVLVGISDQAYEGHIANWMVPVVTIEIVGARARPWRKLVLDQRGAVTTTREVSALYVDPRERRLLGQGLPLNPVVHFLQATNTDGDGVIEGQDESQVWDTAQLDESGRPRFPDGEYTIIVRAWDLAGNLGEGRTRVRVRNTKR